MKKIVRLTESELKQLMENCVTRAMQTKAVVNEHVDWEHEIVLAQKTLMKMSPLLTQTWGYDWMAQDSDFST